MKRVIGSKLPTSREATVKLKNQNEFMVMVGTPLECRMTFMDQKLVHVRYKYSWVKRHWYTSTIGRNFWTATG